MSEYAAILCARMYSGRLPGKALAVYCPNGVDNLTQIIHRWQASERTPMLVVSTTTQVVDDAIEQTAERAGVPCYRGHPTNVVEQMNGALMAYAPDARHVARALADNPLVDVALADWRYDVLVETGAEGVAYTIDHSRITYAGTTDVWSRSAWDKIVSLSSGSQLEHPGAHYWDNLGAYNFVYLQPPRREYLAPARTELDTPQDLEMLKALWSEYELLSEDGNGYTFPTLTALRLLEHFQEISNINAAIPAKTQTQARYTKGLPFLCRSCQRRAGTIVAGDLVIACPGCGSRQKFYSRPPTRVSKLAHHY